ncbi:MAG: terminase small subunit [Clostridia bacterium]|nr:terminase small subunit [Clostridia bacterium]
MNDKEKLFCRYYMLTGNPREAAARAGYRLMPERWGLKLLERTSVREYLSALEKRLPLTESGRYGLERIAFGSTADAIRLLLSEMPPTAEELETMDLFMISEIKRPKGGGVEIKFFDRLKAMELLCSLRDEGNSEQALPFYQALTEGARKLKGVGEE